MTRALVLACLVLTSTAHAGDEDTSKPSYRAVIDRVDLEPSSLVGYRLRIYLSALALQGQLLDLTDPKSIKLVIAGGEKKLPFALGRYEATDADTSIVIMVQSSLDFTDALPMIADAIDRDLLATLHDNAQVAIVTFGEAIGAGKLAPAKGLRGKVQLAAESGSGDPTLLDTLDRALRLLKKPAAESKPVRRLVVIVGDGRDVAADKDRITRTATKAGKDGVRIHTIAYSPNDVRRPMLVLGELAKRSFGTFRWVRKDAADSWKAAFQQLRDEINKQYVLTYFTSSADELADKKLHVETVGRTVATSNEIKVPAPTCGGNECKTGLCANDKCLQYKGGGGRGIVGWLLIIGGGVLGMVILLGVIGYFMSRKQQPPGSPRAPKAAKAAKAPKPPKKQAVAPGFLPNGRPIPGLLILSGPRTGERHLLRNGYLIGKQPGCDLLIEDGYTSTQHAQIGMDPNGICTLYDRGSTNGTFVNNVRITQSPLQHGCTIRIGSTEIRFLAE